MGQSKYEIKYKKFKKKSQTYRNKKISRNSTVHLLQIIRNISLTSGRTGAEYVKWEIGACTGAASGVASGVNLAVDAGVFNPDIRARGFGAGAGAAATRATTPANKICK